MKMRSYLISLALLCAICISGFTQTAVIDELVIDETANTDQIEQVIKIDKVWAGHPVGFCLLTHKDRQYIAYYNAERSMVVGTEILMRMSFRCT